MLTEASVIRRMRTHLEGQFPKACNNCRRRYGTLREYLLVTKHLGSAMSYDADRGNWLPVKPMGTVTYATCPCGSTLVLSSKGMALHLYWALLMWARDEVQARKVTPQQLLDHLCERIYRQVLDDPKQECETDVS